MAEQQEALQEKDRACDVLRAPFKAVDAQQVAKAVGMQHPMQQVHCGVKDGHWSHEWGPCTDQRSIISLI